MSQVTFHGNPVRVDGRFPVAGEQARPFTLVGKDQADVSLASFKGKRKLLNIFPSVDTGVCATALRKFNELASKPDNAVVLGISADLPFAQARFCGAEGISNVQNGSCFRSDFGNSFGVKILDGALKGLLARAIVVVDEQGVVTHTELVSEIAQEPNYDAALAALR